MRLPSGENDAAHTAAVCPCNGVRAAWPVVASHSRRVLSSEAETMRLPSGENEAYLTRAVCPSSSWID